MGKNSPKMHLDFPPVSHSIFFCIGYIPRDVCVFLSYPIGSMYGIYANIWGILMVNVTIYTIHGSYGICISVYPQLGLLSHHFQGLPMLHWSQHRNMAPGRFYARGGRKGVKVSHQLSLGNTIPETSHRGS